MANKKHFPSKKRHELNQVAKTLVATGVISGVVVNSMYHVADASEIKDRESTYVEKNATATDPSFRHTSVQDLHDLPSFVGSSFIEKYNQLSDDKKEEHVDDPLMDKDKKDKSFIKMTHQDYLHYISANGDNMFVHYVTKDGKNLGFSKKDDGKDDNASNNGSSHAGGGFFVYPFMLGGTSYHSSGSSPMKSDVSSSTGKGSYSTNPNSKSFKSSSKGVSQSMSKASSRGMGGSMSSGGRGSSSGGGG